MELSERVDKVALIQQLFEFITLFVCEASLSLIGFGIFQVDFLIGHIHVTRYDNRLRLLQLSDKVPETVLKLQSVIQANKLISCVWFVQVHQVKLFELKCDDSSLLVVLGKFGHIFDYCRR